MREILFRGKRLDDGEFVYGNLFASDTDGSAHILCGSRIVTIEYRVDPATVGQYTGLTDKNGVKIFEGDIVKTVTHYYGNRNEKKVVVKWDDDIDNDSFGEPFTSGYVIHGSEWEVIGNIHDNSDLLND